VPQVELPLGATEDRICGTIDIEKALTEGVKAFEPGLLVRVSEAQSIAVAVYCAVIVAVCLSLYLLLLMVL
jgi:hypothetical protein